MRKAIFTLLLLSLSLHVMAQPNWKWGRSGGSRVDNFNDFSEFIYDIAADRNGNIYAIGKVYAGDLHVNGVPVTGQGAKDILLTSFACDGTYRWSKVIGGDEFDDMGASVKVDTLGGVYVCGNITMLAGTPGQFGDTVVSNTVKSLFLVKFDTAGDYQWLRMPQADTVDVSSHLSTAVDMDVTPDGHIRMLTSLAPGAYANGAYVVSLTGMHMLHYDQSGTFIDALEMDMNITGLSLHTLKMARDHHTGRYYISGAGYELLGSVFIGGVFVTPAMYAASFDQNGVHSWTLHGSFNDNSLSGFFGRPQLDDSGYVYFSGHTSEGDLFANTYAPINALNQLGQAMALPFVAKVDSNANLIWAKHASVNEAVQRPIAALRSNDEIIVAGSYSKRIEWEGYAGPHLSHNVLSAPDIFITRINTHTGAVIKNDTLSSDASSYESVNTIAFDGIDGVVIGGYFMTSLYVSTDTLTIDGGTIEPDFYMARYAETCNAPQSVAPLNTAAHFVIYPNPASSQITFTTNTPLKNIIITNVLGAIVKEIECKSEHVTVNINDLTPGIYFVKVTDLNGTQRIEKIIKQ
jgi:hypothetical protein